MKKYLTKFERFETHHRIAVFSVVLVGTIILTRLLVLVYNPNPILFNIELHHFDYGILLLLVVSKLLLFSHNKYNNLYLFLVAISSGLIIDEYWFVRRSVVENPTTSVELYNATFPSVMILILGTILTVLFINSIIKHRKS
ncbi:MAG: hypothetical protein WCW47_01575 [Candidatus Paceibacterota bacterium]